MTLTFWMEPSTQAQEWFNQAEYDLGTAEAMFRARRYIYTVFMCHLCLEKALKGLIASLGQIPLKSHDLIFLSTRTGVAFPTNHIEFIEMLNDVSVPTRYPDELRRLMVQYPKTKANDILKRCREVFKWLKSYLPK